MTAEAATTDLVLSTLPPITSTNGWGPVERDMSNGEQAAGDGRTLTVGGVRHADGLGVHAPSDVRFTVPAGCTSFSAVVGVDDEVGSGGSVVFQVFDGTTKRYDSGLLRGTSAAATASAAVTPGSTLRLVVTDGGVGDGNGNDHADWAGARLTCGSTTEPTAAPTTAAPTASTTSTVPVSALTPSSSANGWGPVERSTSNGEQAAGDGRTLTIEGRRFAQGLGVHAPSDVRFTVPAGCTTFSSVVGVDDEVGKGGSVTFQVFDGATKRYDSALMRGTSAAKELSVPVTPGSTMRLVVTDGGVSGTGLDHGDWADARLTCAASAPSAPEPSISPTASPQPTAEPSASTPPAPTVSPSPSPTATTPSTTGAMPVGVSGPWRAAFADEFSSSRLDTSKWSDHDAWQTKGYGKDSAWFPVPHTAQQIESSGGVLTMKNRRASGLPDGKTFTSAHINTWNKYHIPAGATSYTEARLKAPSAAGTLPGFWLLGNGTSGTGDGWPISGEVDILEFANNKNEQGAPYFSVWYPKDVYTNPPGTFLNGTHDTHPSTWAKRPELLDTWHTWGLFRSPQKMELYIDGTLIATFRPGQSYHNGMPLPQMLFSNAQHLRLSLMVGGGWAGNGYTEPQYGEGDLAVDYVRVWTQ